MWPNWTCQVAALAVVFHCPRKKPCLHHGLATYHDLTLATVDIFSATEDADLETLLQINTKNVQRTLMNFVTTDKSQPTPDHMPHATGLSYQLRASALHDKQRGCADARGRRRRSARRGRGRTAPAAATAVPAVPKVTADASVLAFARPQLIEDEHAIPSYMNRN